MRQPTNKEIRRLVLWTKARRAHYGQIDRIVEDVKNQQANKISNRGYKSQVKFLLKTFSPKEFKRIVRKEMRYQRRFRNKAES